MKYFVCLSLLSTLIVLGYAMSYECPESCHGQCSPHCVYHLKECKPIICWNPDFISDEVTHTIKDHIVENRFFKLVQFVTANEKVKKIVNNLK